MLIYSRWWSVQPLRAWMNYHFLSLRVLEYFCLLFPLFFSSLLFFSWHMFISATHHHTLWRRETASFISKPQSTRNFSVLESAASCVTAPKHHLMSFLISRVIQFFSSFLYIAGYFFLSFLLLLSSVAFQSCCFLVFRPGIFYLVLHATSPINIAFPHFSFPFFFSAAATCVILHSSSSSPPHLFWRRLLFSRRCLALRPQTTIDEYHISLSSNENKVILWSERQTELLIECLCKCQNKVSNVDSVYIFTLHASDLEMMVPSEIIIRDESKCILE